MSAGDTHFGFEEVPAAEKQARVGAVFESVAERYDLMNDLMSMGLHRSWKRFTTHIARVRPGARVLDLAGGTGDLTARLAPRVGDDGAVVLAELAWVLRGPYGYGRSQVAAVLRQILRTVEFVVEEPTVAWAALAEFESGSADFADCWIGHSNRARGCERTFTFDVKAARGTHFALAGSGG